MAALRRLGLPLHDRAQQHSHAFVSSQLDELGAIGLLVPAIFLGVAVFLLHASLLRMVELQRAEIGIVKALGFAGSTIVWHYLKLALLLAGAAADARGGLGIVLGYGMTSLYAEFFRFPIPGLQPRQAGHCRRGGRAGRGGAVWGPGILRPARLRASACDGHAPRAAAVPNGRSRERWARQLDAPTAMVVRELARRPSAAPACHARDCSCRRLAGRHAFQLRCARRDGRRVLRPGAAPGCDDRLREAIARGGAGRYRALAGCGRCRRAPRPAGAPGRRRQVATGRAHRPAG